MKRHETPQNEIHYFLLGFPRMRAGLLNCDGFFRDGGILHYARQSGDYGGQRLSNKLNK